MALAGPRPAVGAGEAAGKPERAPRGPWAVPPGAASRPARPPAGPTPSSLPARPRPDGEHSPAPGRPARAPALHSSPAHGPDRRETHYAARAPLTVLPPSAGPRPPPPTPAPSIALFLLWGRPSGACPDPVTRADGTARTPCPPSLPEGPSRLRQAGAAQRCSCLLGRPQSPPPARLGR